ncbi:hypothetical protein QG37_04434 [Candidozyma auris]|nr:hypothetical protein QG37_04434 [[Candida] auris]
MLLSPGAKWSQNVAVYPNRAHEQGMKRRFKRGFQRNRHQESEMRIFLFPICQASIFDIHIWPLPFSDTTNENISNEYANVLFFPNTTLFVTNLFTSCCLYMCIDHSSHLMHSLCVFQTLGPRPGGS